MAIRYQDENGNWVTGQKAIETSITDQQGNFTSKNVEGALRELAEDVKNNADVTKIQAQVEANKNRIASIEPVVNTLRVDMNTAQEDIAWLKVNGGGGGGTAVPTITSTFTDCSVDKGKDVIIPLFFSSPNQGAGTAYISVDNIQVDTAGVSQGNNQIKLLAKYLTNTENHVSIYVKDRAGIVSNLLSWTIIAGGIELTSTFDYEVDYGITDTIRIPYTIDTGITEVITLTLTIDNVATEYNANNGLNYIDLQGASLGLGTHAVKMVAKVGKYISKEITFNLVIVSTSELYLSSTFVDGSSHTYGVPILVNYRLSKKSTEEFNVFLKIDGTTIKTQKLTVGSYYWTIQSLGVGHHTITIQAVSLDYTEDKSITLNLEVVKGEYVPVEPYSLGLLCDLNAVGRSNDDDDVLVHHIWKDTSGNGHDAKLINFNFGTNGFVNDTLVCDNDAYAVIEWSPWQQNALTGSTIDIIYTPINSGVEDCRVIDYTQIIDDLSEDEIKPFKGVFADTLMAIPSSASSGTSAGRVNLDDESGEIHLTWVIDRTNKFCKTYINGVLSRIMYLTDSGTGVGKFYEDFSLDSFIYLNSTKGLNCGTNNIKRFRVYDHALDSDKVLQNHLANITDLAVQEELYNFNYKNTTLPKMYLTGDTTNMTHKQTVPMKIEYVSPNEEKYGPSFNTGIQNNPVCIQGTSSLQYVRKNYTIWLKDEYGSDMYYNPYGTGSKPDYVFCLKCDYVESSHANNTGVAKFVNDCLYDTKTPMQLADSDCRTAINGFPIEVYMNGEYLGVYNFNHDRYSYQSYGYDYKKNPNMLVYEINSNSNTSAGAFYRYGDNAESSANVSELEYYKRDFNLIYGNRTTDSDTYSEIKSLVEWVSIAEQDLFRETVSEHFNKEYLFRYFLMVLFIGAVDSLGKNMKIFTMDGKIWYPQFYDLDTVLGIDNSGYLTIQPDVEIEDGSYNTSNSNLWSKVWNFFNLELKEEWKKMRQDRFTLDNLMKYIYGEQISKIPTKLYNDDAQVKYLDFGSLYTYCCHGSKEHQVRRWLRERIAYVDSMLGYFTSQEDQVTIRMNKTGYVSFEVTPYIPIYFSVKWSNATGGTQTFKLKRGETKTFYYTSTTSTDQEVLIYHAQHIKRLDNLSNLNPSSCILANAKKLTNVEIHSKELYNINVTNNIFLRNINLRDCSTLGTVTATGSSLDLSKCKYLRHCDVYNTALTEVQLDTSGGSLVDIYYPKTIQSINLIKQRLLETVGLPYGTKGEEIPTSLYNISIQECPSIKKLNTSSDPEISSSFASMVYCNNLTLRNSLDLATLNFDGFYRLKNVVIENMYNLQTIGFNNLLPAGDTSTLKYVGMSNCPKLSTFELNCTSNDYEITLADDAILNLGGLISLKSITSNCVLKGIKTIIVPTGLDSMFFTNTYGSGYSTIKNIWVSSQCNVNTGGTTPTVTHVIGGYEGIDFAGMSLKNIDLGALVNIPKAINFSLSPTTVNPNFNKNRDGSTYPYLQPEGTLDLTNYTESLARFFDGVDLDKLQIVCNGNLPQTDLSYCFYNSSFSSEEAITTLLSKVSSITNLDYCFYRTTITSTDILSSINMGTSSTMNYTFAECPNITSLSGVIISRNVTAVEGMFYKCPLTSINNITVNVAGSISGLFKGCSQLTSITNLRIPNVSDASGTFEGCSKLAVLSGFELPASCTNVSNLFKGCYMLTELAMNFGSNITEGTDWYPPNLEILNDTTISNDFVKLTNCSTLKTINNLVLNVSTVANFLDGTTGLKNINGFTVGGTCTSVASLFKDKNLTTGNKFIFGNSVTDFTSCFENCQWVNNGTNITIPMINNIILTKIFANTSITTVSSLPAFGNNAIIDEMYLNCTGLTDVNINLDKVVSMGGLFKGCTNLVNINGLTIPDNITTISALFYDCTSLTDISGMTFGSGIITAPNWNTNCPIATANNVTIKNNVVKFTGCSSLIECKNLSRPNSIDWTSFFENCTKLKEDIIFPSNTINVTKCFKGCTAMTYIHSNWNNTYDGEITSTDCYSGCTSITHCDGIDLGVNEYISGLDEVPTEWGGYGFGREDSCFLEIEIPNDNYTFGIPCYSTDGSWSNTYNDGSRRTFSRMITWGDNTDVEYGTTTHTYKYAGTYVIKGKFAIGVMYYQYRPDSFKECIRKIIRYPIYGNTRYLCENCSKLTYVDISDNYNTDLFYFAKGCSSLKYINMTRISPYGAGGEVLQFNCPIIGVETWNISKTTSLNCIFEKYEGTTLNVSGWDTTNITTMKSVFSRCSNLTTIYGLENWDTSNVTDMESMFNNCSSLTSLDLSNWNTSNVTNMNAMFKNCSSLTSITGIESWNTSKVTNMSSMFQGCTKLSNFDFIKSWNFSSLVSFNDVFQRSGISEFSGCTATKIQGYINGCFQNCPNVTKINYEGMNLINVTANFYIGFTKCSSLKEISFKNTNLQFTSLLAIFEYCNLLTTIDFTSCYFKYNSDSSAYDLRMPNSVANITFSPNSFEGNSNVIINSTSLTVNSLLSLFNALITTSTSRTITIGSTNLAKLTPEQIKIATDKNWTVV